MPNPRRKGGKKKEKKNIPIGVAHIQSTFNNTIVTISSMEGDVLCWSSSGSLGFKGSRKSTPFAARLATEEVMKTAQSFGIQEVDMIIKGPGPGREATIRAVQGMGITVRSIEDVTPVPHNGCRPPKRRRV